MPSLVKPWHGNGGDGCHRSRRNTITPVSRNTRVHDTVGRHLAQWAIRKIVAR
jgi:hypothetical protein